MNCQLMRGAFRLRRRHIAVVGMAISSARALELIRECEPDIAVVSSRLQEGALEGFQVLRCLRSLSLKPRIVFLLESRERDIIIDAFRFGAHGLIFRDEPVETLSKCIHAVHSGQVWANAQQLQYLLEALARALPPVAQKADGMKRLTPRELEIVQLVSEGLSNRDVSIKLQISEHTVRNYLLHVFDKLGVSTRVELVLYYMQKIPGNGTRPDN